MQFPSQFIGCKTSFYCFSWHLEQAEKYLFASVRRGEFENLENKIVLEIDYSKAKGNLGKLIVFSAATQLQRKLSKPNKPQRLRISVVENWYWNISQHGPDQYYCFIFLLSHWGCIWIYKFWQQIFSRTNWKFQGNIKIIKLCSARVAQLYQ